MKWSSWSRAGKAGARVGRRWEAMLDSDWLFEPVGRAGTRSCVLIGCLRRTASLISSASAAAAQPCVTTHTHTHTHAQSPEITLPGKLRVSPSLSAREVGFIEAQALNGESRFGCRTTSSSAASSSSSSHRTGARTCCPRGAEMDRGAWRHATALFGNTVSVWCACWSCARAGVCLLYVECFSHSVHLLTWINSHLKECSWNCYSVGMSPDGIKPESYKDPNKIWISLDLVKSLVQV